ncbi:MAG: hypothetical protein PWQ62_1231 [Candidatus Methanomethylophilaceae archaeon]|nr:hypothetical protein [Candidatus Methanomethylophilaceae archaeon]
MNISDDTMVIPLSILYSIFLLLMSIIILITVFIFQLDITAVITAIGTLALAWFGYKSQKSTDSLIRDNQHAREIEHMKEQLDELYQPLFIIINERRGSDRHIADRIYDYSNKLYLGSDELTSAILDIQDFLRRTKGYPDGGRDKDGEVFIKGGTPEEEMNARTLIEKMDQIVSIINRDHNKIKANLSNRMPLTNK